MSKKLNESVKKSKRSGKNNAHDTENPMIKVVKKTTINQIKKKVSKKEQSEETDQHTDERIDDVVEPSDCSTEDHPAEKKTMTNNAEKETAKKNAKKDPAVKNTKKEPSNKNAKKDTAVKETVEKETTDEEIANKKPAKKSAKKETTVRETAKKSAKKETAKKETAKKETTKKSAEKDTIVTEADNKKPAKKNAKKDTIVTEADDRKPAKKSAKKADLSVRGVVKDAVKKETTKKRTDKKETIKSDDNAVVVAKENSVEDRTNETRLLDDVEDLLYNKMRFEKNFLFYRDPHPDDFPIVRKYMQHIFGIIADGFDKFEHIRHQSMYIRVMMVHPITRKYFAEFISCHEDKNEKYIHYIRKVNDPKIVITRIKDDNSDMHEVDFELYKNTANYLLLNSSIYDYVVQLEFNPY